MRILYPSDPSNAKAPDDLFAAEYNAASAIGLPLSLFSFEDLVAGAFRARPLLATGEEVLYRGWMLAAERYPALANAIRAQGARPFIEPEQYTLCHHLPKWYPLLIELTPTTHVFAQGDDYVTALHGSGWPGYFVKDFVKSLTTTRGSLADTPEDIGAIVSQIERYRGGIEGGVCVRRREDFVVGTEQRFFVLNGKPFGASDDGIPTAVSVAAQRVASPFFSVDVAERRDGILRIIEIGDGQVSDRKHWPAERFIQMLASV
jgi:hypothetical protein